MYKKTSLILLLAVLILGPPITAADTADDYAIRWTKSTPLDDLPAAHLAANPAQGFDAWIASGGIRIKPHEGDWNLGLELLRVGREGAMRQVEPAGVETKGARAELHRGGDRQPGSLVEWYVNDEKGLEQGFTIATAPQIPAKGTPDSPLVLELALEGDLVPHLAGNGRRVNLLRPGSPLAVLVYNKLVVVDAQGRELPARMEVVAGDPTGGGTLRIVVTEIDATYPVTVDPLMTTATWSSSETDWTWKVAWGDWDGDGDLDLAVGNSGGQPNRVYENNGGALVLAWTSTEADYTLDIAWGDWDGDGDLDLAAGNYGPNRVYENTGGGLETTYAWSSGEADWTYGVAWGDWDNDGDLDLAIGNSGGYPNRVYENTGGDLDATPVWNSAEADSAHDVAWGDWDGDGDLDLAVGNSGQPNRVYKNTGGDLELAWTSAETESTLSIVWGDWDGDGDLDLAAGNLNQPNRVYRNTGGDLDLAWSSTETGYTNSVAWGDWDGDGDLDLAVSSDGPNRVYENTGNTLGAISIWESADSDRTYSIAWGDWDNDGDLDLAAGNDSDSYPNRVYENSGHALAPVWTSTESEYTADVAWGDWDGDGDLDLVAGNMSVPDDWPDSWSNPHRIYENNGGDLTSVWSATESDTTVKVAWGDWDGDGDLDIATANWAAQADRVYGNNGGVLISAWTSADFEGHRSVAWGDWDGDGDLDLAAGGPGGPTRVYQNTNGNLASAWTSAYSESALGVAWGDWDGDGDLDLATANQNQLNRVYENIGGDLASVWTSTDSDLSRGLAWGDWDGDGDLDLVVANYEQPNRVYENTGGDLASAWTSADSDGTFGVAWGDWDGDGDLDLAAANPGGPNRIYENIGGDLVSAWTSAESENTWNVAWGDWDGDGDLDLAAANYGTPNSVYENGVLNRPGHLPETPTSPVISQRPGTTNAAFFHSTPELLRSPIVINYTLVDEESDPARRISPEYSLTGGGSWLPATAFLNGGTEYLPASPQGEPHTFLWDATTDNVLRADNVVFRITVPYQASTRLAGPIQRAAMSATSPPFRVGDPVADLSVTKSDGQEIVIAGEEVTYIIQVTNQSPEHVLGARVSDTFPSEITDVTWTCDDSGGGTCSHASGDDHINESVNLPAGTSVTFSATGIVDPVAAGRISNTVTVTLPEGMTEINPADNVATDDDWVEPPVTGVNTLILTHPERMGLTVEQAESLAADLLRLASHPQIRGKVVDLGEDNGILALYLTWDADSTSYDAANAVLFAAGGVHDLIRSLRETYTHVEYLILVGGDEVIPFARFEDRTHKDYRESVYTDRDAATNDLWGLSPDNTTVGQALTADRYLSDDPLAAAEPLAAGDLDTDTPILPDLAVGRLLESADDVAQVIDAFIDQGGVLDLTGLDPATGHKVLLSGYHYQLDIAKVNRELWKDALDDPYYGAQAPVNDRLVGDDWNEDDLLGQMCGAYGISNLNGHATHWELGAPGDGGILGFHGLTTTDLVAANACDAGPFGNGPPDLGGKLIYTADCHGGLPVANTELPGETLDLSEALASLGVSSYVANSGFGWGLKCGVGYSELLVQMFTEYLIGQGTTTVGDAVNAVKSRYRDETLRLDDYDLKTLQQWRLTGIPNLELRVGDGTPPAAVSHSPDGSGVEHLGPVTIERHFLDGSTIRGPQPPFITILDLHVDFSADGVYTKYNTFGEEVGDDVSCLESLADSAPEDPLNCQGCYYTLNGLVQQTTGEADLPVQPYFVYDPNLDGVVQQGVLWQGGTYEVEEDWAPVFGSLISEGELGNNLDSMPQRIYIKPKGPRLPTTGRAAEACPMDDAPQTIALTTAEVVDDPESSYAYSLLKLHREVNLEVFYLPETEAIDSCDRTGPTFGAPLSGGDEYHQVEGNRLSWEVPVSDPAGVWRVVMVYDDNMVDAAGFGRWRSLELSEKSPGTWSAELQLLDTSHVTYSLQAVDDLGNVSWWLHDLPLPPSGIPLELPRLVDVTVPSLSVPWVDGAEGMSVDVFVELDPLDEPIAAVSFWLDYDETCLDPDVDDNGVPDDYETFEPSQSSALVSFVPGGSGPEIGVVIAGTEELIDDTPELLRVRFAVTCSPPSLVPLDVAVDFSAENPPSFGNVDGHDVPGSTVSGGVRVWPGPRGDCNFNGVVTSADATAVGLEIFDGDGDRWNDAPGGSFPGSPVGCDANADLIIGAADSVCVIRFVLNLDCPGTPATRSVVPTLVTVSAADPGADDLSWISVGLEPGYALGAVAFSLDLDATVFDLSGIDADADGFPDHLRFPNGSTDLLTMAAFDAQDLDGELDLLLTSSTADPLAEVVLVEIGVPVLGPAAPTAGLSVSDSPEPSFGTIDGADMDGKVEIVPPGPPPGAIFIDGFETGNCSKWSSCS